MKQTRSFQRWQRRYFRLRGRTLYYAKEKDVSTRVIRLLCLTRRFYYVHFFIDYKLAQKKIWDFWYFQSQISEQSGVVYLSRQLCCQGVCCVISSFQRKHQAVVKGGRFGGLSFFNLVVRKVLIILILLKYLPGGFILGFRFHHNKTSLYTLGTLIFG